jgi:polysaccharide biosynthesis transport protein
MDNEIINPVCIDAVHGAIAASNMQIHRPRNNISPFRQPEPSIGLPFLLQTLRHWWKYALPAAMALAGVGAVIACLTFVPAYEAAAWLRIDESPSYIAFESRQDTPLSTKVFSQTQIELIHSPLVLGPALPKIARLPEIAKQPDPIIWLAGHIQVKSQGESELFRVFYQGPEPEAAAQIVNAVVDSYFKLRESEDGKRLQRVIELLDQERDRREKELTLLRGMVRDLAQEATGKDPFAANPEPSPTAKHPLANLQANLVQSEVEKAVLSARIKAMEETAFVEPVPVPESAIKNKIEENPEIQRLEAELREKQARLQSIDAIVLKRDKSPSSRLLAEEIKGDENKLGQFRINLRKQILEDAQSSAAARREEKLAEMRTELETRRITINMLTERYESQLKDIKETSGDTMKLKFKQAELDRAEKVFALIAERSIRLRTEQRAPERVVLMQSAETPIMQINSPWRNTIIFSLAGFFIPLGFASLWERLARYVGDASRLEQEVHLNVVGEISKLPSRRIRTRRAASKQIGLAVQLFEESIDSLRTSLMLSDYLRDMRVLTVTSAAKQEGKTSVSAQLARSLSRVTGQPILLIDGDLRSPNIHQIFNVPLEPGLVKVLKGECSLENAIVANQSECLHILPAGRLDTNPHQLLGNGAIAGLLRQIPSKYRYIVIDTSPVLAASETLVLTAASDASLVCVMRDVSRMDQLKKTYERLIAAGSKPVGLVINGIPTKSYAYRYGSYAYNNKT